MPEIRGVMFNDESHLLVKEIIVRVRALGNCDDYGLQRMHGGKGELRIAHIGPDTKRMNARGVFARIVPTAYGAAFVQSKKIRATVPRAMKISKDSLPEVINTIEARMRITKISEKVSERVEPNLPGTVQEGQFESKRSKH